MTSITPDPAFELDRSLRFPKTPPHATSRLWRIRHIVFLRSLARLRTSSRCSREGFGIITYHRVSPNLDRDDTMLNVHPDRFRQQLQGLLELGYQAWPLKQVVACHRLGLPLPRNVFVVVFDDGYGDVYRNAWPTLCELQIPATVFLATAYLDWDRPFPFDDWSGDRDDSRPLSTDECRAMYAEGLIDLGSHTHTHADFRGRVDAFRKDVQASVGVLRERFGITEPTFSYPYGFADESLAAAARDAGVCCALTAECELVLPHQQRFGWGRFGATEADTPRTLAAKLDGWYSFYRELWHRSPLHRSAR